MHGVEPDSPDTGPYSEPEIAPEFETNGHNYRIERGRKPNTLRFLVDDQEKDIGSTEEQQGENKEKWKIGEEVIETKRELAKSEIDEVVRATARQLHGYCERCIKPHLSLIGDRAITIRVDLSNLSNVDVN